MPCRATPTTALGPTSSSVPRQATSPLRQTHADSATPGASLATPPLSGLLLLTLVSRRGHAPSELVGRCSLALSPPVDRPSCRGCCGRAAELRRCCCDRDVWCVLSRYDKTTDVVPRCEASGNRGESDARDGVGLLTGSRVVSFGI